ncbi:MAG TPA: hypothetical protein VF293_05325 [Candidatus Limnocylindrales bacterium]
MTGRVRLARLTDLAALGELSRLSQAEHVDARSLGLPVSGPRMGVFSLFRLPLGAFRPNDLLFVYEDERRISGLVRVERDSSRDEWTIVELDAIGSGDSGDTRFRLVQHLLRDGAKRGAIRFHVACSDRQGNPELFMQAGFARYGQERLLFRGTDAPLPAAWTEEQTRAAGIRPCQPLDALPLARLYAAVTPQPVVRLESYRLADWERQGSNSRVPRSSLAPILRFAEMEAYAQVATDDGAGELQALLQLGVAREEQPHYLKVLARPETDIAPLVSFGLGLLAARIGKGGSCPDNGVLAPVRTYESPIDRRLEEAGFVGLDTVTLFMKEAVVRVAEPALVPAVG